MSTGVKTYTCIVCGYIKTESIPTISGDSGYIPPIFSNENKNQPMIKGKKEKLGWNAISGVIKRTPDGKTITIDMNGTSELPEKVAALISGRDIELVLEMEKGIIWTINGQDVTDPKTVDLKVTVNAGAIPMDVINNVAGENYSIQISLAHNGELGFTAILSIDLGSKNDGYYANLFYYVPESNELEFMDHSKISKGKAELAFNHASDWAIVVGKKPMGEYDDISSDAGATAEYDSADMTENKYIFIIPVLSLAALGAVAAVRRKIKK